MSLKSKFLKYVELQRSARQTLLEYGYVDVKTIDAYSKANEMKRLILDDLDSMENDQ